MKKILCTLLLMAVCSLSFAQYVRRGSTIAVNGQEQDKTATLTMLVQVGGQELADNWSAAASQRGLGIGLTAGGFTVAAIGSAIAIGGAITGGLLGGTVGAVVGDAQGGVNSGVKAMSPAITGGLIAAGVGLAAGIVGIVQISSAKKKLNGMVSQLNGNAASLSIGAAPSGVGLTYSF